MSIFIRMTGRSSGFPLHIILIIFAFTHVMGQDPPSKGFVVPTEPVLPSSETHPSLYFHSDGVPVLKDRMTEPAYAEFWQDVVQQVNTFKPTDPAFQNENARPKMAKTLAFWWLLTEDIEARDKAVDALMVAWDGVPQTGEKPYDEIYRATWLQNYCAAYDWVHDQLTAEEDSTIRSKIAEETQFLRDNLTDGIRMAPRPHNHRSKPAWAICTAALTLSEHPNAADWLEYGLTQVNTVTEFQFTEDGIYREGGHYWVYSAVNFIPFLWHYYNVSGVDLFPYYEPAFTWTVAARTGQGWIPNFEDSNVKPAPTHMVATAYRNTSTPFHDSASLAEILQWNYWSANVFTTSYTGATKDVTWEIDNFILYDSTIEPVMPNCHPTIKLDGGQVIFRNRWEGGEGHRYMAFHGPSPGDNHDHPDQLNYVIEADQGFVMPDAGYGPDGFSDDRRNTWYVTSKAHNIITANFYTPTFIPSQVTPPTPYFITSDFFSFAEKQMAFAVFPGLVHRRGIAYIGGDYWIVTDLLTGGSSSVLYRSYLHGRGTFDREANRVSWTSPLNKYGTPVRMDGFLFPPDKDISEDTGYISMFWDEGTYTYVFMDQQATDATFMNILVPAKPSANMADVMDLSGLDFQAAKVTSGDTTDIVLVQHVSQEMSAGDVTTEGTFGWIRQVNGSVIHCAFREAQTFFVDARVNVETDSQLTAAFDFSQPGIIVVYPGSQNYSSIVDVTFIDNPTPISRVVAEGLDIPFTTSSNGSKITFVLSNETSIHNDSVYNPEKILQAESYPNPFNGQTNIILKSDRQGSYKFIIYNIQGRRIWEQDLSLGHETEYKVQWNGFDSNYIMQPTGVYFGKLLHLDSGEMCTVKLVMIQ